MITEIDDSIKNAVYLDIGHGQDYQFSPYGSMEFAETRANEFITDIKTLLLIFNQVNIPFGHIAVTQSNLAFIVRDKVLIDELNYFIINGTISFLTMFKDYNEDIQRHNDLMLHNDWFWPRPKDDINRNTIFSMSNKIDHDNNSALSLLNSISLNITNLPNSIYKNILVSAIDNSVQNVFNYAKFSNYVANENIFIMDDVMLTTSYEYYKYSVESYPNYIVIMPKNIENFFINGVITPNSNLICKEFACSPRIFRLIAGKILGYNVDNLINKLSIEKLLAFRKFQLWEDGAKAYKRSLINLYNNNNIYGRTLLDISEEGVNNLQQSKVNDFIELSMNVLKVISDTVFIVASPFINHVQKRYEHKYHILLETIGQEKSLREFWNQLDNALK